MNYKDLTLAELKDIFGVFDFKKTPYWHQYVSLAFTLDHDKSMLWHDIGTGKTLIALYSAQIRELDKILVIAPNGTLRTWRKESYSTNYKFIKLAGKAESRFRRLKSKKKGIYWINYEGLKWVFGIRKKGYGFKISFEKIKLLKDLGFQAVIIDEAHRIRHFNTVQTEIAKRITWSLPVGVFMTGTPFSRSMLELWNLYFCLDAGKTLGRSFTRFRKKYFFPRGPLWFPRPGSKEEIISKITRSTMRFSKKECRKDIKDPIFQNRIVTMTKEQEKEYYNLLTNWRTVVNDQIITIKNALTISNKLKQVCLGFLYDQEKTAHDIKTNKYNALIECIEEINGQFVIFHTFKYERYLITKALNRAGLKYSQFVSGANKEKEFNRFIKGKTDAILIQPKVGGEGLDGLQKVTNVAVFFSNPDTGAITREQSKGRIDRVGQKNFPVFIDIFIEDSIEELDLARGCDSTFLAMEVMKLMEQYGGDWV